LYDSPYTGHLLLDLHEVNKNANKIIAEINIKTFFMTFLFAIN
jgi:hypothetical protein